MAFINKLYHPEWTPYGPVEDPYETFTEMMRDFDRTAINRGHAESGSLNYLLMDTDVNAECRDLMHAMNFCAP